MNLLEALIEAGSTATQVCADGRVVYPDSVTPTASDAAISADWDQSVGTWRRDTPRALAAARDGKIANLQADCEALQSAGVHVGGITLAATEYDQRRLATLLVGLNNAIEVGAMTADSPVTVWDAAGVPHTITVTQYKQMAAAYMAGCMGFEIRLGSAQARVAAATTQDAIDAVTL